jgi:mono/diheme cytochrome c family protein
MSRIQRAFASISLLVASLVAPSDVIATGDEDEKTSVRLVGLNPGHEGYSVYERLCSECHGVRADGNGTNAREFDPPPPDLTVLRGPDGGPQRIDTLARVIDGRRTIRAHEAGGMPIWGERLVAGEADFESREVARIHIVETLASYVRSIQTAD